MKDILNETWMIEMIRTVTNMYDHGWDERNGGNVSMLLEEEQVADCLDISRVIRTIPTGFAEPALAGKYFLVTGTGKYFRNIPKYPERDLGIIRIAEDGVTAELLWGYSDGGKFTSELPAHLMSHMSRMAVNPENRVILHCHPTYTLAMNFVHPLEERRSRTRCGRCAPSASSCSRTGSACCRGWSAAPTRSAKRRRKK